MTSSVVGLRRNKAKCAPKKGSWLLFGSLLPVQSTVVFWILAKPIYQRSMFSKLVRCTENCRACPWQWSTERAQLFFLIMPYSTSHNRLFKSLANWAMKFCLIHHIHLTSHQLTTTSASISTTFAGKILPLPAGCRKCFPRVPQISRHKFLC